MLYDNARNMSVDSDFYLWIYRPQCTVFRNPLNENVEQFAFFHLLGGGKRSKLDKTYHSHSSINFLTKHLRNVELTDKR
jgi:hypothetical protein